MQNVWTRLNAIFVASLTVLAILCACTTLSTYLHVSTPIVNQVELYEIERFGNYKDKTDRAVLSLDIDADLTSVFNWNVKQLFVFVVAEYATPTNELNQVVIWDKIIQTKADAKIQFTKDRAEYFLADQFNELRNVPVQLKLTWYVSLFIHRTWVELMT